MSAEVSAAETVIPQAAPAPEPTDPAQAAMARLTTEAVAQQVPVAEEPAPVAQEPQGAEPVPVAVPEETAGQVPVAGGDSSAGAGAVAAGEQVVEPAQAVDPAQVVSAPQAVDPAQVVEVAQAVEPAQVVEPVPAPEMAQGAEADQGGQVPQGAEMPQGGEVPQAAEVAAPTEVQAEGVEAVPAAAEAVTPEPEPPAAEETAPQAPVVVEGAVPEALPAEEAAVPEPAEPIAAEPGPEQPVVAETVPAEPIAAEPTPAQPIALGPIAPEPNPVVAEEQPAPEAPQPEPVPAAEAPAVELAQAAAPAEAAADLVAEAPAVTPEPVVPEPVAPEPEAAVEESVPVPQPYVAEPAGPQIQQPDAGTSAAGVPLEPRPDLPLGQFVPVEGQVPTTPHLAPTPPQPIVLPAEDAPAVPAPRAGEPEPVQHAEDLDTRVADQEESTAPVAEARQSTGPAAPAYEDAEREAVLKVMRERRDIRNGFRSDPIPHEVLLRVLEAAHTAPSVGHSQPWDFVVIRSAETRRTMHELAMRQRDAYAKSLPKGRAKQFKELKIEAILDTPVNIVVTADPTRGGRHTLGRHTQPQMAPYSSALAVENLWLAARAEGLGVGWVSFFDEREMVRTLGLPEHLEVVAYLCVGYVDEFPDEPELMQAGWSKRRPLSWVVHEETYGRRALPGEDPHDLLGETVAQIRPLDAKALGEAWERQKRMTKPAGALGMLEIISAQLSGLSRQCPPPIPEPAAVAIFAGDHGVHAQGVTPWPQEVTAQMVANFLGGGAVCNAFAGQVGAEVCVVDVGVAADLPATPGLLPRKVRAGTSDMTTGAAMTREECKQAIEVGIETARDLVAAGNKALLTGEMGIANTTASAALISVFTGADPAEVTGRGTGINDETLARKTEVVRRALEVHQPDPADPIGVLAAIGGFEHAAMVGLLLGGASLRTPVILDGVSAGAAALVARAIAPEVLAACIAGHRSAEPGHVAALNKLGLRPLVDLDLRLGEGTGALLALPLVQSTARAMHEVATFDSAGVTEK
uniref:nicotinate-nucleotide--dimethylbenzimidazole phosphoribosyltransferase n=1 Tax=Streptomyces davaonensis TaxID=348043 RepID=UPI0038B53B0F